MLTHNENMLIVNKYGYFRDTRSLYLKHLVLFSLLTFQVFYLYCITLFALQRDTTLLNLMNKQTLIVFRDRYRFDKQGDISQNY